MRVLDSQQNICHELHDNSPIEKYKLIIYLMPLVTEVSKFGFMKTTKMYVVFVFQAFDQTSIYNEKVV